MSESKKFWVSRDSQNYGPYSLEELESYVSQGFFNESDSACEAKAGANWKSVGHFTSNGEQIFKPKLDDPYKGLSSHKQSKAIDEQDLNEDIFADLDKSNAEILPQGDNLNDPLPTEKKISEQVEKELSGNNQIVELMESCLKKAQGNEDRARLMYEKVRYKQLSREKKNQDKKIGIGCLCLIFIFSIIGFCSDSGPERSPEWDEGRSAGYLAASAIINDGQSLGYDKREALIDIFCKYKSDDYKDGFGSGMDQAIRNLK
jgi:hypothetical protein